MELQQLLKQWKFTKRKDYMEFLDQSLKLQGSTDNTKIQNALYKLLQEHLRENTNDDVYIEKYLEFIVQKTGKNVDLLVDFLKVLESVKLSTRILKKLALVSKNALQDYDFQLLNLIWKAVLKIITRDISQDMKYCLFKNAFMEQLTILLNMDLEAKKYYGLLAFYLGHLNAFVKFSTSVLVGEEEIIIGFLVSTGEKVFHSLELKVENGNFESLLVGLQCIVSCFMQQPTLQDSQKVLLVNKIIHSDCKNTNILKSKLYLASVVMKTFDKLDVHAQVELIEPSNKDSNGILDFVLHAVSLIPMKELKTQIWSKKSLHDQLLICFGVMLHGLHGYSMNCVIKNLLNHLLNKTTHDLELFILDLFQILAELDECKTISEVLLKDLMFLLEQISTKSKSFLKISKIVNKMGFTDFNSSWMMYPTFKTITDQELNRCLLLWASPLCSLSGTEFVIRHLESTQKVWRVICSEMDRTNDPASVAKRYHVLGLIADCYIAIFNSKHMSDNSVRKLMTCISREISVLIPALVNGGFQNLIDTLSLSVEDTKFTASALGSIFSIMVFMSNDIQPSHVSQMLDVCVKWIDSSRLNSFFPQKDILEVLEAFISRSLAQPDQVVGKIGDLSVDLNEDDFAAKCPTLVKICPNLSISSSRNNSSQCKLGNHRMVRLSYLKRSNHLESSMDWEKSTAQIHAGRFANGKVFDRKGK